MWSATRKRVGVAFVREQGLELEAWDGGPRPYWSAGVPSVDNGGRTPREMIKGLKVSRWLLVLPTYVCTTRYTWLPTNRPREVAAMLEFEVPRIVPCSTQSWTWDYSIVGEREDGAAQVLVFLSPLSIVETALKQAHAVGIEPRLVTVSAVLHAARFARGRNGEGSGPRGYVWWDPGSLDLLVVDDAELEVGRTLAMLRKSESRPAPMPLHVGGTNPALPHLAERLQQTAGVEVCDLTAEERPGVGATGAEALWARHGLNGHTLAAYVDLLPRHLKERGYRTHRRQQTLVHGSRICLAILLMLACLRASTWRTTQVLHAYEQRLLEIAPLAQKLQFLQGQLTMIRTQVQGSTSMLDIIGQLYERLPPDVTIHYLSIDQDRQVVIRAQAKRLSQAFDCIDPLEKSEYLANVRQNYAHLREMEGQVLIDFELRADPEKSTSRETGK
jgi:hypothetical protein